MNLNTLRPIDSIIAKKTAAVATPAARNIRMIAVLDNLRSSHNVGSIFRTADAFAVTRLYLCGITPSPLDRFGRENKNLTKVSLGAQVSVPWEHHDDTLSAIRALTAQQYRIICLEQHRTAIPLASCAFDQKEKYALVVGTETGGLSETILAASDAVVEIPMRGTKESLNVSVAFGIATFYFLNRLKETEC